MMDLAGILITFLPSRATFPVSRQGICDIFCMPGSQLYIWVWQIFRSNGVYALS